MLISKTTCNITKLRFLQPSLVLLFCFDILQNHMYSLCLCRPDRRDLCISEKLIQIAKPWAKRWTHGTKSRWLWMIMFDLETWKRRGECIAVINGMEYSSGNLRPTHPVGSRSLPSNKQQHGSTSSSILVCQPRNSDVGSLAGKQCEVANTYAWSSAKKRLHLQGRC
jgi:hypothetical protein